MATYFGQCDSSGNPTGDTNETLDLNWFGFSGKSFTCPGSGNQTVKDLSAYVDVNSGSPNIRLSIYDNAGNKVCEGSAQVAVSGASYSWQGHLTQASITPNPVNLTGGAAYRMFIACDASQAGLWAQSGGSSGDTDYGSNDYTGGFPATIPGDTNYNVWPCLRVGVDAEAGTIEQEGFRFRNDDGSESAATWKANQDTNITLAAATVVRIRMLLNATGDPASIGAQLEYRYKPSGGAFGSWTKVN